MHPISPEHDAFVFPFHRRFFVFENQLRRTLQFAKINIIREKKMDVLKRGQFRKGLGMTEMFKEPPCLPRLGFEQE